ncbi:Pentatricopeptide repeat-containing protein [Platanthera guangdongensis]|uniref:Pentatricopeptide repeat-containing protein n=1 Tax=Platanthera guangdongensis TaxID=2320717 RepID=A0ABR2N1Q7_9ASPA
MHLLVKIQSSGPRFFHHSSLKLGGFSSKFHLFFSYHEWKAGSSLNHESFTQLFKSCSSLQLLKEGKSIHADAIKAGFDSYTSASNSIMSFYFKVGMKDCARKVFDQMPSKDSVSWNAVIHGFLSQRDDQIGLLLFTEATACSFLPNASTLVLVLQACWLLKDFSKGENLHGFIIKTGFTADIIVQNSLLNLYRKSKDVESAQNLFDEMPEKDIVSWSSLISGYAQTGCAVNALQLFQNLSAETGIKVDGIVLVNVLQACSFIRYANHGKLVHSHVILRGFEDDLFISNSLINMYSKCLDMNSAYMVFAQMPQTNLVSWNAVLSGLLENERPMEACLLFESMKKEGIEGDEYTVVILLQACKKLGHEAFCRSIHSVIIRKLLECNDFVLNSLLDAYTKCGLMELALKLFEKMPRRDVISWSTMLSGFSHCGDPRKAVTFFVQMRLAQEAPNFITMLSLLEACSALADLKLSKCVHGVVVKNDFSADLSVETALLSAYGKCGSLDMSRKVFEGMNEKNVLSWNAMIGALGKNGCAREALASLDENGREECEAKWSHSALCVVCLQSWRFNTGRSLIVPKDV